MKGEDDLSREREILCEVRACSIHRGVMPLKRAQFISFQRLKMEMRGYFLWSSTPLEESVNCLSFPSSKPFSGDAYMTGCLQVISWHVGWKGSHPFALCHVAEETVTFLLCQCSFTLRVGQLFPSTIDNPTRYKLGVHCLLVYLENPK